MWGNNCFIPGRGDGGFNTWFNKGVENFRFLCRRQLAVIYSHLNLCEKCDITRNIWSYSRISNCCLYIHYLTKEITLFHINGRGQFSLVCELLLTYSKDSSSKKLETQRIDIKEGSHEIDWEMACFKAQTKSQLLQNKWFMWTYLRPRELNHILPNVDICVKFG